MGGAALGRLGLCGLLAAPERPAFPNRHPSPTREPWTLAPPLALQRNACLRLRPGLQAPPTTPPPTPGAPAPPHGPCLWAGRSLRRPHWRLRAPLLSLRHMAGSPAPAPARQTRPRRPGLTSSARPATSAARSQPGRGVQPGRGAPRPGVRSQALPLPPPLQPLTPLCSHCSVRRAARAELQPVLERPHPHESRHFPRLPRQ